MRPCRLVFVGFMKRPIHPLHHVLVLLQLGFLVALVCSHTWLARAWPWSVLEGLGVLLGLWALIAMRWRQLRIHPEVSAHAELRTTGPYRWIRHPMYASLLLVSTSLALDALSFWTTVFWLCLVVVLVIKLRREEALLRLAFPDYAAYARRTARLVPGVW